MTFLTKPERAADRAQRRRIAAKIHACGGCGCCVHRDKNSEAWNRAYCSQASRSFPLCTKTPGIGFELDEETVK